MNITLTPQPKPEPTREQLQLAYRHLANPHWPPTLDEALARWAFRKVLHSQARVMNRPQWHGATHNGHSLPRGPVPPTPEQHELYTVNGRPAGSIARGAARPLSAWPTAADRGAHDCKRAAANDTDTDKERA